MTKSAVPSVVNSWTEGTIGSPFPVAPSNAFRDCRHEVTTTHFIKNPPTTAFVDRIFKTVGCYRATKYKSLDAELLFAREKSTNYESAEAVCQYRYAAVGVGSSDDLDLIPDPGDWLFA